jgi:hypothetical protein
MANSKANTRWSPSKRQKKDEARRPKTMKTEDWRPNQKAKANGKFKGKLNGKWQTQKQIQDAWSPSWRPKIMKTWCRHYSSWSPHTWSQLTLSK